MPSATGTPDQEWLQESFSTLLFVVGIGCGAQLVLYIACVRRICSRNPKITRRDWILLVFLTMLCCTNILYSSAANVGLSKTFVANRDYPGGPFAFIHDEGRKLPSNKISTAAYVTGNLLADGLLFWRCTVIWTSPMHVNLRYVMLLPGLMLVTSFVMAVMFSIETLNTTGMYASSTSPWPVVYFSISLSLNILLTSLIVGRMLAYQRSLNRTFTTVHSGPYRLLAVMFIESAALYAIVSIGQLVTITLRHESQQLWTGLANATQLCSNYLIVYRVLDGSAWSASRSNEDNTPITFGGQSHLRRRPSRTEVEVTKHVTTFRTEGYGQGVEEDLSSEMHLKPMSSNGSMAKVNLNCVV